MVMELGFGVLDYEEARQGEGRRREEKELLKILAEFWLRLTNSPFSINYYTTLKPSYRAVQISS